MGITSIEWTATVNPDGTITPGKTWNPVRGCSRVSEGCRNCYAERQAARFVFANVAGEGGGIQKPGPFHGFVDKVNGHPVWTGKVELIEHHLEDPLHWRKPCKVFVNSMSDLFHDALPDEAIDRVFAVMALCPQHTFQILTKRPERMLKWFDKARDTMGAKDTRQFDFRGCVVNTVAQRMLATGPFNERTEQYPIPEKWLNHSPWLDLSGPMMRWPLFNVWLGVSVEDQKTADERIPLLLQTPAAVRFVSYEPALGPVSFRWAKWHDYKNTPTSEDGRQHMNHLDGMRGINWVIVGGESGPGARPFDIAWARNTIEQCKAAGVACFVKQLGAHPQEVAYPQTVTLCETQHWMDSGWTRITDENGQHWRRYYRLKDHKGGDWNEWQPGLRVREFPEVLNAARI